MNQQAHKIKPQFGLYKEIDSLESLQPSSKKSYKFLSKLTIAKQSTKNINFHKLNKKISSSLKSIRHLDFSSFWLRNFKAHQFKLFLKKFYKIHKFINPYTLKTSEGLIYASFLLYHGKYLKNLDLQASFKDLTRKFVSRMNLYKIKTLNITQVCLENDKPEILINLFKSFPSTLENLSLFSPNNVLFRTSHLRFPFSKDRLKNIRRLELGVQLGIKGFTDIIKSIPDPSKLKSLRFHLTQEEMFEIAPAEIGEFLNKCVNLEELDVRTDASGMTNFYSGAANLKLKKLTIEQAYKRKDDLLELENLIQQQSERLESFRLSLRLGKFSHFGKLYEKIILLKNVKKLELKLFTILRKQTLPIYEPFAEILETLNCLEQIDFQGVPSDSSNKEESFYRFCKALQKHSQTLKSLKLSLKDCKHSDLLAETLKEFSTLEHLTLHNVPSEGLDFYNDLRDIICKRTKNLNSVVISKK